MRSLDDRGTVLDAEFDVEPTSYGVDIVLHSRSGGINTRARRNLDYFSALEAILARLAAIDARILSIAVDSLVAQRLPDEDRVISLNYPIRPAGEADLATLRRRITEGQRKIASRGASDGHRGNNHKRIRIAVDLVTNPTDLRGVLQALRVVVAPMDSSMRAYRYAAANPSVRPADLFTFDPEARERSLATHARVQNGLAHYLKGLGRAPLSPTDSEPDFDLAWMAGSTIYVAEVKSLSGVSTTHQLRLGLGQVLQYRALLRESHLNVVGVLAVEYEPEPIWSSICADVEIRLTWPEEWPGVDH